MCGIGTGSNIISMHNMMGLEPSRLPIIVVIAYISNQITFTNRNSYSRPNPLKSTHLV